MHYDDTPKYYVYVLIDPRKNTPFYIGKGSGERINLHEQFKDGNGNVFKDRTIKAIHREGLSVIKYKLRDNLPEKQSYDIEEQLILFFGRRHHEPGGCLCNITIGDHPPRSKFVPLKTQQAAWLANSKLRLGKSYIELYGEEKAAEVRKKQSKSNKGKNKGKPAWSKGKHLTQTQKANMSVAAQKRVEVPEYKKALIERCRKNALNNKGRIYSEDEHKKRLESYVKKNRNNIIIVFGMIANGITNKSELMRKTKISYGKIETMIKNKNKIEEVL